MAEGRRERMRLKIRSHGVDGLPAHELVEFLLYPFIPRKDTSSLAKTLLKEFGGLDELFNATEDELSAVPGMPKMASLTFPLYKQMIENANILNHTNYYKGAKDSCQMGLYCSKLLENCYEERVIAVYCNNNEKIIGQKVISKGNSTNSIIDFNLISKFAILYGATGVVIAHNHPGGTLVPSLEDKMVTEKLSAYLKNLKIRLLDHFIVSEKGIYSLFNSGKIDKD